MTKHRSGLFSLTVFSTLGIAAYAYLGNFTRLLADDFCSIHYADRLGLFRSIWFWYLNWSGRYTAFAADWLILKSIFGPYRLHYAIPITILVWLILLFFAIYLYLEKQHTFTALHAAALAGIFLFLVFLLTPDIPQSLFWWNGMRIYALPLVLFSFDLLLFQVYKRLNIAVVWGGLLGFLLFFTSGGMGETMAVAQIALLLFLIGLDLLKITHRPSKERIVFYCSLAGAVCSLVVVLLSPGTKIRKAFLPPTPDIVTLVTISLQAYGMFLASFFREPAKITGLVGAILSAIWIGGQYRGFATVSGWLVPICILGGILISLACFPPGVYGYSEPPPARIGIIPVFFLVTGLLCAGFITGSWLVGKEAYRWLDSYPLVILIVLFMVFSSMNTVSTLLGERGEYMAFAGKWARVDAQILQAKAEHLDSVNIPAMDNWAGLERPTDNPNYWPTQCYSVYYGIQVVGPPYSE